MSSQAVEREHLVGQRIGDRGAQHVQALAGVERLRALPARADKLLLLLPGRGKLRQPRRLDRLERLLGIRRTVASRAATVARGAPLIRFST
jgi:hypothetical protein